MYETLLATELVLEVCDCDLGYAFRGNLPSTSVSAGGARMERRKSLELRRTKAQDALWRASLARQEAEAAKVAEGKRAEEANVIKEASRAHVIKGLSFWSLGPQVALLALLTTVIVSSRYAPYDFYFSAMVRANLLESEFERADTELDMTFHDVSSLDDVQHFLQGPLLSGLYVESSYADTPLPPSRLRHVNEHNLLVGPIRLTQAREARPTLPHGPPLPPSLPAGAEPSPALPRFSGAARRRRRLLRACRLLRPRLPRLHWPLLRLRRAHPAPRRRLAVRQRIRTRGRHRAHTLGGGDGRRAWLRASHLRVVRRRRARRAELRRLAALVRRVSSRPRTWRTPTPCTFHAVHC